MFVWLLLLSALPTADWPMIAHDPQRTARTPARGEIQHPVLAGELDTAAHDYFLAATLNENAGSVELSAMDTLLGLSPQSRREWGMRPRHLDVVGNGDGRGEVLMNVFNETGDSYLKRNQRAKTRE